MMRATLSGPVRSAGPGLICIASVIGSLAGGPTASAQSCRAVTIRFTPQGLPPAGGREALSPQIAVWVEDTMGRFVADVYVTRLVGLLGLGNRPGQALLKSDYRWPYGRRPMALPIWAHRRGKTYNMIVMGGGCSTVYDPDNPKDTTCNPDFNSSPSDDDTTIAYHGPVSSNEPFYCSPSGWRTQVVGGVDVVSCASAFFGSKGWYAVGPAPAHTQYKSVYPPRADLMNPFGNNDSADTMRFSHDNDVAAVSAATPPSGAIIDPPVLWQPPADIADGDYVLNVEVNIEEDFNAFWQPGKCVPEPHMEWNQLGHDFIGQPSILYQVPFRLNTAGRTTTGVDYAGYGDWKGDTGTINKPDSTISTSNGSGADRLKINNDANGPWRVKVSVGQCPRVPHPPQRPGLRGVGETQGPQAACMAPTNLQGLDLSQKTDSTVTVGLVMPDGVPVSSFEVRYQQGMPVTDANFSTALPAMSPTLELPGDKVYTQISGLLPSTMYYVAARAKSSCGLATPLVSGTVQTASGTFTTLHGCFIATAAYGSELAPAVDVLRRVRDRRLLTNPLGQVLVASYYALSPPLAGVIAGREPLRALARRGLSPIVALAQAMDR